jgi:hypothetical protein
MTDPEAKRVMRNIAKSYDFMAELAIRRGITRGDEQG